MKIRISAITFIGICLCFASCTKQNLELLYANQENAIDKYVTNLLDKEPDYSVTVNNGSNRITINGKSLQDDAEKLSSTGTVSFYYSAHTFNGSIGDMFDTNDKDTATQYGWEVTDKTYGILTLSLEEDAITDGLRNGLEGVRAGEECYIIFTGKYGFGKKALGTIPANSSLFYHIWVESISND